MGGLNISHPQQVNEGLMLNTLERLLVKDTVLTQAQEPAPNIVRILQGLLAHTNCIDIHKIFRYGGTNAWRQVAARINAHNTYLGGCMFAMARFVRKWRIDKTLGTQLRYGDTQETIPSPLLQNQIQTF